MNSRVCIECGGTGYVTDPDARDHHAYPCDDCKGSGREPSEPTPDPLDWNPATDPVVRAILAMGEDRS